METICQEKVSYLPNAFLLGLGQTRNMPTKTKSKPLKESRLYLREWRKEKGLTQEALAAMLNTEKGTISKLERGLQRYHQEWLEALAYALDLEPADLLKPPGGTPSSAHIPVFGYAGAREEIILPEGNATHAMDETELPSVSEGYAAVIVRGESMQPAYRPGDLLLFLPHGARTYALEELYDRDCVVVTEMCEAFVNRVRKGRSPGLVDLVSYNPVIEPLYDQRLRWGAPILWVRRR